MHTENKNYRPYITLKGILKWLGWLALATLIITLSVIIK